MIPCKECKRAILPKAKIIIVSKAVMNRTGDDYEQVEDLEVYHEEHYNTKPPID